MLLSFLFGGLGYHNRLQLFVCSEEEALIVSDHGTDLPLHSSVYLSMGQLSTSARP